MRIQHLISSININRQLNLTRVKLARVTEKLSSGHRINNAADDAAGLSISEKLRSQIRSLERASLNIQDGISMIQTADGALIESEDILNRMRELAIQGANDILSDEDRLVIKAEVDQLGQELDRIALTTNFNGKYILSGQYQETSVWTNIPELFADVIGTDEATGRINIQAGANAQLGDVVSIRFRGVTAADLLNGHGTWNHPKGSNDPNWVDPGSSLPIDSGFVPNPYPNAVVRDPYTGVATTQGFHSLVYVIDGICPYTGHPYDDSSNSEDFPGLPEYKTGIPLINEMRSELGAVQNRLEHSMENAKTVCENLISAESQIRDADMAKEMMGMTKEGIINQSATAMLAQANQLPQSVLTLLQ
jgi:flagellin